MRVSDYLDLLSPMVGFTSLAVAPESVATSAPSAAYLTLDAARLALEDVLEKQRSAGSDPAWWGYEGRVAYWRMAVNLFEAEELVGPNNLPEFEIPNLENQVVMDACYDMESLGKAVLNAAKQASQAQ